jgi:hypothetical protein
MVSSCSVCSLPLELCLLLRIEASLDGNAALGFDNRIVIRHSSGPGILLPWDLTPLSPRHAVHRDLLS